MQADYFVLVIEVADSNRRADRQDLSFSLEEGVQALNRRFQQALHAPFEVSRGNAVLAVLTKAQPVYAMYRALSEFLHPVTMRMVLGYGALTVGLETHCSNRVDGPALRDALMQLELLKKSGRLCRIATGHVPVDPVLEVLMNLLMWQWQGLTALQHQVLSLYLQYRNQRKVADMLGRYPQQVQSSLQRCGWEVLDAGERQAGQLLRLIDRAHRVAG